MDLKQAAISISMIVFVLSSMLGMGLGLRVSEIVAPLRNWRLVMLSLVANFVVMPFAALALARILRLDESMGIGLLLLGLAGGAPFLPKLAQIAKGNLAFAVGLMVLLMVITVGYLPHRVAPAAARRLREPGANCAIARAADAASIGGRAGGQGESSGYRREDQAVLRQDVEPQPDRADGPADVVERPQRGGGLRHRRHSRRRRCFWAWASPWAGPLAAQRGTRDPSWGWERRSGTSPPHSSSPTRASRIQTSW